MEVRRVLIKVDCVILSVNVKSNIFLVLENSSLKTIIALLSWQCQNRKCHIGPNFDTWNPWCQWQLKQRHWHAIIALQPIMSTLR